MKIVRDFSSSKMEILKLTGHVDDVTWHPKNPNILASGGRDRTIRIWDVSIGITIKILTGYTDWVLCVAWHPKDPNILASGSSDRIIQIWSLLDLTE